MSKLQDFPDISSSVTKNDKVLVVRNNDQGLVPISSLPIYVEIPEELQNGMDAVLNKKFGTSRTYPAEVWPDDVNLLGPLVEKTTTNDSIVSFSDGADDVPTKSLVVTIPPTLDGKSEVTETQTGRNLFNVSNYSQIYTDRDGVDSYNYRYMIIQLKPNTTYTVSQNSGEYSGTPIILINNALPVGGANYFDLRKASDTKTYTTDSTGRLYIGSVNSYDDVAYERLQACKVQIEVGSTAHAYEPYTAPTTYTANLGRTIYGGQADIVNGVGKETHKGYTLDNLTWSGGIVGGADWCWYVDLSADGLKLPANSEIFSGICDNYTPIRYNGVATNQNTIALRSNGYLYVNNGSDTTEPTGKVTIELDTGTDFTFDGQEINTRLGYNAFWSDSGDTEVTYRSSGTVYTYPNAEEASF